MGNIIKSDYEVLDLLYGEVNTEFFNGTLPAVVLTIQKNKKALGTFTPNSWEGGSHEVNISANHLKLAPYEIIITLQHEMIHVANYLKFDKVRDVIDGQRHNDHFKTACEEFDLYVEAHEKAGYVTPGKLEVQSARWQEWYAKMVEKYQLNNHFKTCLLMSTAKKEPKSQFAGICSITGKKVYVGRTIAKEVYESGEEYYSPFARNGVLEFDYDELSSEF